MNQKTYMLKAGENKPQCFLIDAKDKIVGKVATKAATILRGKHKPVYTPYMDSGDMVVIINAEQVKVSGKKATDKLYQKYTGFHGGHKYVAFQDLLKRRPTQVLELAVNRMIPRNPLGYKQRTKLRIYAGNAHPHTGQKPIEIKI